MKQFICIIVTLLLLPTHLFSQTSTEEKDKVDQRLFGVWSLETVKITTAKDAKTYTLEALFADKSKLPRNLFTMLYFVGDEIGIHSTETEFVSADNVSLKGSFTTNNGEMIVTMQGEQARTFTYTIENERLEIWYTKDDTQYYLMYKLTAK